MCTRRTSGARSNAATLRDGRGEPGDAEKVCERGRASETEEETDKRERPRCQRPIAARDRREISFELPNHRGELFYLHTHVPLRAAPLPRDRTDRLP